jgi:hypothetical protein
VTCLFVGMQLAGSIPTAAEDVALTEIRAVLLPMRTKPADGLGPRGAALVFTDVKHRLRDWIEGRLHEFRNDEEVRAFAHQLNAEIRTANLSCHWDAVPHDCPDRGEPGYLGEIRLELGEMLVVTTNVGIVCGFDESAYAYYFVSGRWRRFWQAETNDYTEGKYAPLNFLSIQLSSRDHRKDADPNVRLLLMLARDPAYCESNWYNVYYRVWQVGVDHSEAELLLDGGEEAFLADSVDGIVDPQEVLIQYSTRTAYTDFQVRTAVRHYVLRGGKLEREAPLALIPRDFADEWMRTDWAVSSQWTAAGVSASSLQPMHTKENFEGGEYTNTVRCEKRPEHWQVGLSWIDFDAKTKTMVATKHLYFLVRWLPPYRFSMAGVSDHPWSGCTERDRAADEPGTLFPVHLQRRQ